MDVCRQVKYQLFFVVFSLLLRRFCRTYVKAMKCTVPFAPHQVARLFTLVADIGHCLTCPNHKPDDMRLSMPWLLPD